MRASPAGHVGVAQHHEAALVAALAREALHQGFGLLDEAVMHPHHEVGHAAQVLERRPRRLADAGERGGVQGVARHLAGDQHRHLDGLRLALGVAGIGLGEEARGGEGEPGHGVGEPALRLRLGLGAPLLQAAGMRLGLGAGGGLGGALRLGARAGAAEVGLEQERLRAPGGLGAQ